MTQVPMTLTLGQGQRSKVKVKFSQKMSKINQRTGHITEAISPTDFILGTKVQPIKAHSNDPNADDLDLTLTFGRE